MKNENENTVKRNKTLNGQIVVSKQPKELPWKTLSATQFPFTVLTSFFLIVTCWLMVITCGHDHIRYGWTSSPESIAIWLLSSK